MNTAGWLVFAFNCFVLGFVVGGEIAVRIAKAKMREMARSAERARLE